MFVTIITDCQDSNAVGRQETRMAALFGSDVNAITTIGVSTEIEAAGNLVDVLDAAGGASGIVLVNVAPRGAGTKTKGWENGTPFCYFVVGGVTVISSIGAGITLHLVKKLGLVNTVCVLDVSMVMNWAVEHNLVSRKIADKIIDSQFRSFEFLPCAAKWLCQNMQVPSRPTDISDVIVDPPPPVWAVWYVDCFGNCKTTLLISDFKDDRRHISDLGLSLYRRLSDVPDGELAWVIGSSGFGEMRFLELVVQNGDASERIDYAQRHAV